jgi:hypothetical protein
VENAADAGFAQAGDPRALHRKRAMIDFDRRSSHGSGARHLNGHFGRLCLAIIFSLTLARDGSAQSPVQTVRKWGLIGPWSQNCALPPDRDQGAVLDYEIERDSRVMHRRNFGDVRDESEVVFAEVSGDGMLNLRVFFPSLKQVREYGLLMQPDGTMRAMYNRNSKGEYSIKDGKFIANGNPTPPHHRCK